MQNRALDAAVSCFLLRHREIFFGMLWQRPRLVFRRCERIEEKMSLREEVGVIVHQMHIRANECSVRAAREPSRRVEVNSMRYRYRVRGAASLSGWRDCPHIVIGAEPPLEGLYASAVQPVVICYENSHVRLLSSSPINSIPRCTMSDR